MPMKETGTAASWREIDEWDGGTGWIAYPDEAMQRASHLLTGDDGVWLVDPVDFDGLDEFVGEYGDLRGVVLLLDRHKRDAAPIARRHDVPVYVPDWMGGVEGDLKAEVTRIHKNLPDTEFGVHKLIDNPLWKEAILYGETTKTLVVPEAVGTTGYVRTGDERLGVHPALRLTPPWRLRRLPPERILLGHGAGVFEDAEAALLDALDGARRRAPRLYAKTARSMLP